MNYIEPKIETQTETKVACEVYSRIVGYMRPINQWNKAKKEEFYERRPIQKEQIDRITGGYIA